METSECRSCGAEIIWTITTKEKKMPVDAEPNSRGNFELHEMANGEIRAEYIREQAKQADADYYTSHFSTCPYANQHRK